MPSLRSAWAGAPAMESARQSVPMLTVAAALAIVVMAGGWLSHARQAPAVDATQLESWRAMVVQAMEPEALQKLRQLARSGSVPAQSALGEAFSARTTAPCVMKGCAGWKPLHRATRVRSCR